MARIGDRTVHLPLDDNTVVTLRPGDLVPSELEKYFIGEEGKPHRALAHGDAPVADVEPAAEPPIEGDYEAHTVPELKDLLKARELPQDGNKSELIARLREADAEPAAPIDEDLGDPGDGETEPTEG